MRIDFHYETDFRLVKEKDHLRWVDRVIRGEGYVTGALNYVFCDDEYLLHINQKHLNHDTLTDIITFDYSEGNTISGDIFISSERVLDNAALYEVQEEDEMRRVMAHGVLHMMGYGDKTTDEKAVMRGREDALMGLFHVEQ